MSTYNNIHAHTLTHVSTHSHMHAHTSCICTHTHSHTCMYTESHTQPHLHAHNHIYIYSHNTHTQTQTQVTHTSCMHNHKHGYTHAHRMSWVWGTLVSTPRGPWDSGVFEGKGSLRLADHQALQPRLRAKVPPRTPPSSLRSTDSSREKEVLQGSSQGWKWISRFHTPCAFNLCSCKDAAPISLTLIGWRVRRQLQSRGRGSQGLPSVLGAQEEVGSRGSAPCDF